MDKVKIHKEICLVLNDIFEKKNHDYGNSVSETYKEFGMVSYLIRIADKYNRAKTIVKNGTTKVSDESLRDTLLDMANYCILAVMEMESEE